MGTTRRNINGCKVAQANNEGADFPTNPSKPDRPLYLEKKEFADILKKLQPSMKVATPACQNTTTPVPKEGGVKRKSFNTARLLTPPVDRVFKLSNNVSNMDTVPVQGVGLDLKSERACTGPNLKCERPVHDVRADQISEGVEGGPEQHEAEKCVHLRGGWCCTHLSQARKIARIVKTREKLKSGLFGTVRRRRTEYQCELKLKPSVAESQPGPSVSCQKVGEVERFLEGGITCLGESEITDRRA